VFEELCDGRRSVAFYVLVLPHTGHTKSGGSYYGTGSGIAHNCTLGSFPDAVYLDAAVHHAQGAQLDEVRFLTKTLKRSGGSECADFEFPYLIVRRVFP